MADESTEPWRWSEETWRGHVERVRAGRSLLPAAWPEGARVAVALSFDSDHDIVEIPVEWIRDDAPYFMMERYSGLRPYTPPRDVLGIWREEFDHAYAEGGLFQLTLHPHIIGHRSRLAILAELLDHIVARPGVWFATHARLAEYVAAEAGLAVP